MNEPATGARGPAAEPGSGGEPASRSESEPAPLFGRWWPWYVLVALDLLVVILVCAWITRGPR